MSILDCDYWMTRKNWKKAVSSESGLLQRASMKEKSFEIFPRNLLFRGGDYDDAFRMMLRFIPPKKQVLSVTKSTLYKYTHKPNVALSFSKFLKFNSSDRVSVIVADIDDVALDDVLISNTSFFMALPYTWAVSTDKGVQIGWCLSDSLFLKGERKKTVRAMLSTIQKGLVEILGGDSQGTVKTCGIYRNPLVHDGYFNVGTTTTPKEMLNAIFAFTDTEYPTNGKSDGKQKNHVRNFTRKSGKWRKLVEKGYLIEHEKLDDFISERFSLPNDGLSGKALRYWKKTLGMSIDRKDFFPIASPYLFRMYEQYSRNFAVYYAALGYLFIHDDLRIDEKVVSDIVNTYEDIFKSIYPLRGRLSEGEKRKMARSLVRQALKRDKMRYFVTFVHYGKRYKGLFYEYARYKGNIIRMPDEKTGKSAVKKWKTPKTGKRKSSKTSLKRKIARQIVENAKKSGVFKINKSEVSRQLGISRQYVISLLKEMNVNSIFIKFLLESESFSKSLNKALGKTRAFEYGLRPDKRKEAIRGVIKDNVKLITELIDNKEKSIEIDKVIERMSTHEIFYKCSIVSAQLEANYY